MNFIQRFFDDREVDTLTVTITSRNKSTDLSSVMIRHRRFTDLVTECGLELAGPLDTARPASPGDLTLRGRRKNLRKFKRAFDLLDAVGAL